MTDEASPLGASLPEEASMEGVLASIRRILQDDKPDPAAGPPGHHTVPETDMPETSAGDVFVLDEAMMIEEPVAVAEHDPLLAPETQSAASSSLGDLVRTLSERHTAVYRQGPTLEDIVREEMRPLVKSWLDANMAPMVERLVREEIERVVRQAIG